MLILRTCTKDRTSNNNFQWPELGPVECPDWKPVAECGNGLHGLPWGEGHCCAFDDFLSEGGLGQVVEVDDAGVVMLENGKKCKFERGNVVFTGPIAEAVQYLLDNGGRGRAVAMAVVTAQANGVAVTGYRGTATAGNGGTATAGDRGTATAGDCGTATAGNGGTATAGYRGTATAGNGGTATAGECGIIEIASYDWNANRYRRSIGYIGEAGLLPNVKYKLEKGVFVPAEVVLASAPAQAPAEESHATAV